MFAAVYVIDPIIGTFLHKEERMKLFDFELDMLFHSNLLTLFTFNWCFGIPAIFSLIAE